MPKAASNTKRSFLFIKSEYRLVKVNLDEVLFLSGMRDYTQIYLRNKPAPLTTLQNLKEFEEKLPADQFVRVHRSYIIAIAQVDYISRNEIIIGSHNIPVGNAFRRGLNDIIEKNS